MWELCLRFFSSVFSFCEIKGYYYWKGKFYRLCIWNMASGLLQIGYKSEKWQWGHNLPKSCSRQFFDGFFVSLVKFSYWSKFHVNIISGPGVMKIFFYKRLTINLEIGNTTVWVLPSIWRLGRVTDTKFSTNVSNEMVLNAAKCKGYSFYRFWGIKVKPTGFKQIT